MKILAAVAIALALTGCASTQFQAYEGRGNVYEGRGGTKAVVDGMEIWEGEPPRKYALLGVLKDERPGGPLPMAMLRGDMVKKAKEQGASALIDMGGSTEFVGTFASGNAQATAYGNRAYASGTSTTVAMKRRASTFAVIRYLD